MQTLFTQAFVIACIFAICKFIELRFVRKDVNDGLKPIPRETFIVFISSCVGIYIIREFMIDSPAKQISAFIDIPTF
uniref:Uncharacterized protein n=1 Tax=viral metagenome TaxID=1070528 RepID=A0A6C0HNT2_9ZZZZ